MRMQKQEPDKNGVGAVEKYFKLTSNINTTNMVLIKDGRVKNTTVLMKSWTTSLMCACITISNVKTI